MAITSYPFDNQNTTETQFSHLFRELQDSGVAGDPDGNDLQVSADSTGMDVQVQPGFALLRGHAMQSTAVETVAIEPASASTRYDLIVLRLDPALNSIALAVIKGVPGSSTPTLTQTDTGIYEIALAVIVVTSGTVSIASGAVTGARRYVGSRVGAWSDTTRPSSPRLAKLGLNVTTGVWEFWDGVAWKALAPTVTWTNIAGKPSAFAPSAHDHPWSEVVEKPATFPPSSHGHAGSEVSTGGGASDVETDIAWLNANKSGTGHNHDTRYYTAGYANDKFAYKSHGHAAPTTVSRANGSDRVHGNQPQGSGYYSVWVDGYKNFCKNTSSIRYKENVRDHEVGAEAVLALQPRIYDRKATTSEEHGTVEGRKGEYGLIAEEVAETLPELVVYDEEGRIDALRYDLLAVALLDVVKRQQSELDGLYDELDGLYGAVEGLATRVRGLEK